MESHLRYRLALSVAELGKLLNLPQSTGCKIGSDTSFSQRFGVAEELRCGMRSHFENKNMLSRYGMSL